MCVSTRTFEVFDLYTAKTRRALLEQSSGKEGRKEVSGTNNKSKVPPEDKNSSLKCYLKKSDICLSS